MHVGHQECLLDGRKRRARVHHHLLLHQHRRVAQTAEKTTRHKFHSLLERKIENVSKKTSFEKSRFIEISIQCPLSVCEQRDTKGLYVRAKKGLVQEFTGISSPYETPKNPEIVLRTAEKSIEECTDIIVEYLIRHRIISPISHDYSIA